MRAVTAVAKEYIYVGDYVGIGVHLEIGICICICPACPVNLVAPGIMSYPTRACSR